MCQYLAWVWLREISLVRTSAHAHDCVLPWDQDPGIGHRRNVDPTLIICFRGKMATGGGRRARRSDDDIHKVLVLGSEGPGKAQLVLRFMYDEVSLRN